MAQNPIEDAPSWPLAVIAKADRDAEVVSSGGQSQASVTKTEAYLALLQQCADEVGITLGP